MKTRPIIDTDAGCVSLSRVDCRPQSLGFTDTHTAHIISIDDRSHVLAPSPRCTHCRLTAAGNQSSRSRSRDGGDQRCNEFSKQDSDYNLFFPVPIFRLNFFSQIPQIIMFVLRSKKICLIDEAFNKTKDIGISNDDCKWLILKLIPSTYHIHKYI